MLRILIADEDRPALGRLRDLVSNHPGWEVCAEAFDGPVALRAAETEQPDLAILEIALPGLGAIEIARRLRRVEPAIPVLFLTAASDRRSVEQALATGVRGYVLKSDSQAVLETAIMALADGRPYYSPGIAELVLDSAVGVRPRSSGPVLTRRELEVTRLIADGNTSKMIARQLGLQVKTIESHRSAAMRKARVHTAAELVRFAIRHNLIEP